MVTLLLLSAFLSADPADATIAMLDAGIAARIASYRDLKFEYQVGEVLRPGPSAPTTSVDAFQSPYLPGVSHYQEVFRILDSDKDGARRWKSWERFSKVKSDSGKDRLEIERFTTSNGAEGRWFLSAHRTVHGDSNAGAIASYEFYDCFRMDVFESFLSLGLDGPQLQFMAGQDLPRQIQFAVKEKSRLDDMDLWLLEGRRNDATYQLRVTGAPEFIVRSWRAFVKDKLLASYEVEKVDVINGIRYPAKGKFDQTPMEYQGKHTYAFAVTSASRLTENDRATWQPEWPADTVIRDQIKNQNVTIPKKEESVD